MYLLDRDHLSILQWQTMPDYQVLAQHLQRCKSSEVFASIVSFHEEVRGWNRYVNAARSTQGVVRAYQKFEQILTDFSAMQVLPFDAAAAIVFDQLRSQRIRIGTMDLRVAAIAIGNDLTIVTRNFVDFAKVPGLRVEDWTIPPSTPKP
jgi:tRNA(fMet)-specific endonuclease VapC